MGAYENPQYIGIKDPTAVTKILNDNWKMMLAMMDKINTQKKAAKKEQEKNIQYTTGSLLGSINKIHNTSDITKQNIQNNVNNFSTHATGAKFNNKQLTDAKFSWTNSVGAYNDLLNVAFQKDGFPDISKAHTQYDDFMELIDAVQGDHNFNNPYNKTTNTFDGSFTYMKDGKPKTLSMHEISGILGAVSGGPKALANFEKYYDNTILKNNSIIKVNASNMVNKIFNENGRAIPISDDDIDTVYDEVYSGLNLDIDDEREIWYNYMRDEDKMFSYDGKKYELDYNTADEYYHKIADKNNDGVLSEEESATYNSLNNAAGSLVKEFVKRQVVPSLKTKATAVNNTIILGATQKTQQREAHMIDNNIREAWKSEFMTGSIDKIGPEELEIIDSDWDKLTEEEKFGKRTGYRAHVINTQLGFDKDIKFYGYNDALASFISSSKVEITNGTFDASLAITEGTGKDAEKTAIKDLKGEELDKALEDLFVDRYHPKKYTGGKPELFYTDRHNDVNVVQNHDDPGEVLKIILKVKDNKTLPEHIGYHPHTYQLKYPEIVQGLYYEDHTTPGKTKGPLDN